MLASAFVEIAREGAHDVLLWIGFGTLVGLLAKALMPGRDPGGAITTLLVGIAGSVMGSGILMYCWDGAHVTPISFGGFVVATLGAILLLCFYRLLAGQFFREAEDEIALPSLHRRGRRSAAGTRDKHAHG